MIKKVLETKISLVIRSIETDKSDTKKYFLSILRRGRGKYFQQRSNSQLPTTTRANSVVAVDELQTDFKVVVSKFRSVDCHSGVRWSQESRSENDSAVSSVNFGVEVSNLIVST